MTTKLTRAQLNERITETVEARPEAATHESEDTKYWYVVARCSKARTPTNTEWIYKPATDYTADVGAILGLIQQREDETTIDIALRGSGKFLIEAHYRNEPKPTAWQSYEWCETDCALAPALCCAYWFALKGERVEVEG